MYSFWPLTFKAGKLDPAFDWYVRRQSQKVSVWTFLECLGSPDPWDEDKVYVVTILGTKKWYNPNLTQVNLCSKKIGFLVPRHKKLAH